ncbi:MAG TPA: hypothetical protein VG099_27175 [Gemmataceae bacterium]|nr:hypothetical protein [Gemmataceae bacterium]
MRVAQCPPTPKACEIILAVLPAFVDFLGILLVLLTIFVAVLGILRP